MNGRLSTHAIVNVVLGVVAAVLVATAVYLEAADRSDAAASTTTTTTLPETTTTAANTTTTTTAEKALATTTNAKKQKQATTTTTNAKKKAQATTTTTNAKKKQQATTTTNAKKKQQASTTNAKKKKQQATTTAKKKKKQATTTTTTTVPPPPRDWVTVLVVNGSSLGGRLEPMAATLEELGYPPARGVAGAVQATDSKIYAASEDFRSAGERLAIDIGMRRRDVELFDDAPPVSGVGNALLILYLGGS